jgi:membrane fusion protein, multidrug efflux system
MRYTGLLLIILWLYVGCGTKNGNGSSETQDTVSVATCSVVLSRFVVTDTYFGRLTPSDEVQLISYAGGRVSALRAAEGQMVKRGMSLAAIDAEKALTMAEAARLEERVALSTLRMMEMHLQNGNSSKLDVDQARLSYLRAKNSRIEAEKNYRGAVAFSPISGMVTRCFIDLHQELSAGSPTFIVAKLDTMIVTIQITGDDEIDVEIGSPADIRVGYYPDRLWKGQVKNYARAASLESRTFDTEITIDNRDFSLKSGSTAQVQLTLRTLENQVIIPVGAVLNEGAKSAVMVVDSMSIARKQFIETGLQKDSVLQVLSGLRDGDVVITEGQQLVRDGTPVLIKKAVSDTFRSSL